MEKQKEIIVVGGHVESLNEPVFQEKVNALLIEGWLPRYETFQIEDTEQWTYAYMIMERVV